MLYIIIVYRGAEILELETLSLVSCLRASLALLRSIIPPTIRYPFLSFVFTSSTQNLTMRLRNYKETVPYTIEDTLRDVHPHTLEEPFHWAASVFICSLSNAS